MTSLSQLISDIQTILLYVLGALLVYKFVSIIAINRWKRRDLGNKGLIEVIAHRGSRQEGLPENTIAAFTDAVSAGTDVVELDVWITPDGKVVIHHDETFTRMTGGASDAKIHEVKYGDFPTIRPSDEQSHRVSKFKKGDTIRIPLFEEVLAVVPRNVTTIIEFKQDSDLLISEVKRILYETNRQDTVFWFSLHDKLNSKLRAADPTIPTIVSMIGVLKYLFLYYIGVLPFVKIEDAVFGVTTEEITLEKIRGEKPLKGLPDWFKQALAFVMQGRPPRPMVAPGLFKQLRQRGIPVWVLGVNDEKVLMTAINAGATAVLTDRVNWLIAVMKSKNLKFKKLFE